MGIGIQCCKNCVAPKRHIGCHSTCKEYIDEKAQFEEDKKRNRMKKAETPRLTSYDFHEIDYADCKRQKRRKYKKRD